MTLRPCLAILVAAACTTMGACDKRSDRPATNGTTGSDRNSGNNRDSGYTGTTGGSQADNTARNTADRDTTTKTPLDQSNSKADIDITTAIRRAVMEDNVLSTNAKNCKIITDKGVVTLRGPVATQAEKDSIGAMARAAAGVTSVDNQLEVKSP